MKFNPLKFERRFGRTSRLHLQGWRILLVQPRNQQNSTCCLLLAGFVLGFSSSMKTQVACPSEALVDFQWITLFYIPEDRTHHVQTFVNVVTLLKIVGTEGTLRTFILRTLTKFLQCLSVLSLSLNWIFTVVWKSKSLNSKEPKCGINRLEGECNIF
jgi:hypothetical protein